MEWRIVAACRDGKLYTITSGEVRGKAVVRKPQIELQTQPVALARIDKTIYVATMDAMLSAFSVKGKKLFAIQMPANVACLEVLNVRRAKAATALLVALDNGQVRILPRVSVLGASGIFGIVTPRR